MGVSAETVRGLCANLESASGDAFLEHVVTDADSMGFEPRLPPMARTACGGTAHTSSWQASTPGAARVSGPPGRHAPRH
jgi:hypothetical protein